MCKPAEEGYGNSAGDDVTEKQLAGCCDLSSSGSWGYILLHALTFPGMFSSVCDYEMLLFYHLKFIDLLHLHWLLKSVAIGAQIQADLLGNDIAQEQRVQDRDEQNYWQRGLSQRRIGEEGGSNF